MLEEFKNELGFVKQVPISWWAVILLILGLMLNDAWLITIPVLVLGVFVYGYYIKWKKGSYTPEKMSEKGKSLFK